MEQLVSLVPRPLPDFISQLSRRIGYEIKFGRRPGNEAVRENLLLWNDATSSHLMHGSFITDSDYS